MAPFFFSTSNFSPNERAAAWQEFVGEHFFRLEVNPKCVEDTFCETTGRQVGRVWVSRSAINDQQMVRRRPVGKDENFAFVFPLRGHFESLQRSRIISARPGQAYCLHSAEPYRSTLADDPISLILTAPLHRLKERMSWVEDCFGRSDIADPEIVPILQAFGNSLTGLTTSDEVDARLEEASLDLLTLLLESKRREFRGERIPWSMRETLRTNVRLFIGQNYARHDLTATDAAAALGVSERYIQKAMSEVGTTFGQAVIECRLQEARRLLTSLDRPPIVHIAQIAYQCGFANQAHFSTRYRKRFGHSPRDELARSWLIIP